MLLTFWIPRIFVYDHLFSVCNKSITLLFCRRSGSLTVTECIKTTFAESGIRGFYKGITASYYGISETVIHFVIYEGIKAKLRERKAYTRVGGEKGTIDFIEFMGAGAVSKTIATCVAYPHGKKNHSMNYSLCQVI